MPIYEYRCANGHEFELLRSFSDPPVTSCQVCEAPAKKLLRAPAIHFKGSGFHNTDYGRAKRVGGSGGEGSEGSEGGGSDSKASDSGSGEKKDAAGASKSGNGSSSRSSSDS